MQRPNVLVVAFSADPSASMESRLGWQRAVGAAREYNTWLLCEKHDQLTIDRYLAEHGPVENLHVHYVERTPMEYRMYQTPGLFYIAYHRWQTRAYALARRLHAKVGFDLIHQANFCGYREPGYCWKLDAPFIWGPVGGTQNLPTRFLTQVGVRGAIHELSRSAMNYVHFRYRRRVLGAIKASAEVLVANSTGQRDFWFVHGVRSKLQLETGIVNAVDYRQSRRNPETPLKILWSGRFRVWKALPLLLRALADRKDDFKFTLRVIAYGPREWQCRNLAKRLGIDGHIEWAGWPSYYDSFCHYEWADVFAFTSLRDTSGTGLLEALSHGCPIVGVDHQGAGDIMTDGCAVRISVETPRQVIEDFGQALVELATDEDRRFGMGLAAQARAKDFMWDSLTEEMLGVYRRVLNSPTAKAAVDIYADKVSEESSLMIK